MSAINLRPYQREAINAVWAWLSANQGNCLAKLDTGTGKSICMATFIKEACERHPGTRVMALAHVKELLAQNLKAILSVWPDAPVGLWSAGLGSKTKHQITVAGIQSVHKTPAKFAPVDLVIVDEAHLIPKSGNGMYLKFLEALRKYNPNMRVVGWSATPFRTDSGLLTEGADKLFEDIAYETDLGTMIKDGWLCPLVSPSKSMRTKADLTGVHKRGGDWVPGELQKAMDKRHLIDGALDEVKHHAADRNCILAFCSGVEHAAHVAEAAAERGWSAAYVSGDMTGQERDRIISDFKAGRIKFLANANILTVGFDHPAVDCVVLLRDTQSAGLYLQIAGRGLRKHPSKSDTLFLDFTETTKRFGPIDMVKVKRKGEKGDGVSVAPMKECSQCHELVHTAVMICPGCGHEWPPSDKAAHGTEAADAVIVAALEKPRVYLVDRVEYQKHKKAGKPPSLRVTYWCGPSTFDEWVPVEDERSYIKKHAVSWLWERRCIRGVTTVDDVLKRVRDNSIPAPDSITVRPDGKYWRVVGHEMGSRRLNVSSVIEPTTNFWEQVA